MINPLQKRSTQWSNSPYYFYLGLPVMNETDKFLGYHLYTLLIHALLPLNQTLHDQYHMGGMEWLQATYTTEQLQDIFYNTQGTVNYTNKDWIDVVHRMHLMRIPHAV